MITQSQKEQIRKMAEEHAETHGDLINTPITWGELSYRKGAEALLERLDIDIDAVFDIVEQHKWQQSITRGQAKQQILNAITLKP